MEFLNNPAEPTSKSTTGSTTSETRTTTVGVSIKSNKTTIQVQLPFAGLSSDHPSTTLGGPSYRSIPPPLHSSLESLSLLLDPSFPVGEEIASARSNLEAWFRLFYPSYKLRHIIPRSTRHGPLSEKDKKDRKGKKVKKGQHPNASPPRPLRKSFPLQSPVLRFHVDSSHTDFINLWIPFINTSYPLGFLYDKALRSYVTGEMASEIFTSPNVRKLVSERYVIIFKMLPFGECITFKSGGPEGLVHGSFNLLNQNEDDDEGEDDEAVRESVEFRGQRYDERKLEWEYGTSSQKCKATTKN